MQTVGTPYPTPVIAPSVSGQAKTGQILTCDPGVWHAGFGITLAYQWMRDAADIAGATAATYTALLADEDS